MNNFRNSSVISSGRLDFIDSLRGLAVIFVLILHTIVVPSPWLKIPDVLMPFLSRNTTVGDSTGVIIFFVVSSFSLCYTMPKRNDGVSDVLTFYVRRLFRIAPLFYIALAVTILLNGLFAFKISFFREFLWNCTFLFNLSPRYQFGIVGASWTIGVEMLFYVIFPLLYVKSRNTVNIVTMIFASFLVAAVFNGIISYFPTLRVSTVPGWVGAPDLFYNLSALHNLPVFLFGILAFNLFTWTCSANLSRSWGAALVSIAVFSYFAMQTGHLGFIFADDLPWKAMIAVTLLIGLAIDPLIIFVNPVTRHIGRISYSMYLVHGFVITNLFPVYRWIYAQPGFSSLHFLACLGLTFVGTAAISEATFWLVEQPGIRLGRRVVAGIRRRREIEAAANAEAI